MSPRITFVVLAGCMLAVLLAPAPATAAWTATGFDYSYDYSEGVDLRAYTAGGAPIWRKQRSAGAGEVWVTLTAWGQLDGDAKPIAVDQTIVGTSGLLGKIILSGSPPPPKPALWLQKSWVNGSYSLHIDEEETLGGQYEAEAHGAYGAPVVPPASGSNVDNGGSLFSDGTEAHVSESGQHNLVEPDWYWRTTREPHFVAQLRAESKIDLQGYPGRVVVDARSWARGWGSYHNP